MTNKSAEPPITWTSTDGGIAPHLEQSIRDVAELEARQRVPEGLAERVADRLTQFSGSVMFIWVHAIWFGGWMLLNTGWVGVPKFDAFPFGLLTLIVSLEAIFLSTFVLISQNKQAALADRRATIDLQINVIAEQEVSKLLQEVSLIAKHLGTAGLGQDAELMGQPTNLADLVETMNNVEQATSTESEPAPSGPEPSSTG